MGLHDHDGRTERYTSIPGYWKVTTQREWKKNKKRKKIIKLYKYEKVEYKYYHKYITIEYMPGQGL